MPQATKESFARALGALVRKYEADRDTYLSSQYNEAQTRTQFISPLLEALGWDVRNEAGVPYNQCEVLEEKGETHGRPDYTFRLNGQTKFFLEAKSPSDALSSASILQTKRYAWNSRDIFFAGVCDFEQFRFFDASLRPDEKRPYEGEAFHLIYNEYASSIDKLWELSRDRVAAGSLDQFLRKDRKSLLQRIPVDKDFLDELTKWRQELASAIHAQNSDLDAHQLNDIVQRLLDRIIFIRIAEDRKVIDQRQLWDIAVIWEQSGGRRNIMEQLVELFQDFNKRFNGEIFKPHPCEDVKIDSHVLPKIIRQLYPPKSNYRFDVIGVELLGSIYERYLGNTLRVTAKRVFIEPKPEVRKAGGVYYTPQYIVDYIVKNTVGKLIEDKTPKEVDKIRILDPACGSGSFLIGAFQFLIDWYLDYYRKNPKEAVAHGLMPQTRTDEDGNLRLSFYAKSLILQHNLYGVDIDQQAVEVTMMSLYLKMLEGELGIQIPKQDKLPELKYNIRCGNSLIGPDIEKDKPLSPEERERIRPFDWHSRENGFGDILSSGGFDAVIGNPPYGADYTEADKKYFQSNYVYKKGKPETYIYFLEKGISALSRGGTLGYITPNAWLTNYYGVQLRHFVFSQGRLEHLVDLEPTRVFQQAVVDTAITIFRKGNGANSKEKTRIWRGTEDHRIVEQFTSSQDLWASEPEALINVLANPSDLKLLAKMERHGAQLERIVEYSQGVIPYKTKADGDANRYISLKRRGKEWLPLIESASQVWRYGAEKPMAFIRYGPWLWCAREPRFFTQPKILFHRVRKKLPRQLVGTYDDTGTVNRHSLSNLILRSGKTSKNLLAVLGLFNSKLANWWFVKRYGLLMEVAGFKVTKIPLPPKWDDSIGRFAGYVERMLELNKKKHSGKLAPSQLDRLESEIAATDAEIDNLVYDLYGITKEERKIIEAQP